MSYVRILVHLVFSTKNRESLLSKEIRDKLYIHIHEYAGTKDIFLESIGGWNDHIHLLISLGKEQNISKIANLLKGESSFWINKGKLLEIKFSWQDDYYAVSIGESGREKLIDYIKKQEEHHKSQGFVQEINEILAKYKMENKGK
ncbi:MAG: IS200/IS605 family transposase [Ignavibacteria bacterium]